MDVQINISGGTSVEETAPQSGALTDLDREEVRAAVLLAAQQGHYRAGMAESLLADLKSIKTAS